MYKKFFILFWACTLFLQFGNTADTPTPEGAAADLSSAGSNQALPHGFRGISLGMSFEAVKDNLQADKVFGYRGERDISLLTVPNRSSIETNGSYFIERAWFQFYDETLYTMTLKLNTDTIDYYSMYRHFVEKYGEPKDINPKRAIWENADTRVTIERPLTVKYVGLGIFNALLESAQVEKAKTEKNRENFIQAF